MTILRPARCGVCGKAAHILRDPDGITYVTCTGECPAESAWGITRKAAIEQWNEMQIELKRKPGP